MCVRVCARAAFIHRVGSVSEAVCAKPFTTSVYSLFEGV